MLLRHRVYSAFAGLLLVVLMLSFVSSPEGEYIIWGTKKINWSDFKGKRNKGSSGIASTWSFMNMEIVSTGDKDAEVEIKAMFNCNKSWVIYEEHVVLDHERGHFDITELYTRKLKKKISETVFSKSIFRQELTNLYNAYDQKLDTYQDKYDDETESSMNVPKQREWEKKLKEKIEELKDFEKPSVSIHFSN